MVYSQYKLEEFKMKYSVSNIFLNRKSDKKDTNFRSIFLKQLESTVYTFYSMLPYFKFAFRNNNLVVLTTQHISNSWMLRFFWYVPQSLSSDMSPKFIRIQSEKPSHFLDWSTHPPSWHSNCVSLQNTSTLLVAKESVNYKNHWNVLWF